MSLDLSLFELNISKRLKSVYMRLVCTYLHLFTFECAKSGFIYNFKHINLLDFLIVTFYNFTYKIIHEILDNYIVFYFNKNN